MKELVNLIAQTDPQDMSKREQELRNLILDNHTSEKELAKLMWGKDKHRIEYLRKVKSRLFRYVEKIVFDLPTTSPYQAKYVECFKEYLAVKILQSAWRKEEAIFFAERLIRKALRYEVTEVVVGTADILFYYYGSIYGNKAKADKYFEIVEEYEQVQLMERKAQRYFTKLAYHFTKSRVGKPESIQLAERYSRILESNLEDYQSFRYRYFTYLIRSINAELKKDKSQLEAICNEALIFFQGKSYPIPHVILFFFGFQKRITLAIETKDFAFAHRSIKMGKELMGASPINYSLCLIYQALLGFHQDDDELVAASIYESQEFRNFPTQKEQWLIIDAFAHFLNINIDSGFRLGKFLNEVPVYSQDKKGLNITIIVIQLLFYVKQRKFDALIDRIDALNVYRSRYLKRDHTFRSSCFLKMMLTIPLQNFHPVAVERHTAPLFKKLQSYREGVDLEIVPYERLWKEVLSCVEEYHLVK